MEIKGIASGSKGNAYYISDGGTSILIECGVAISKLKNSGYFDGAGGILISHKHSDHAKSIKKCADAGAELFAPAEVFDKYGLAGDNCHSVSAFEGFCIGSLYILPFDLNHDCINFGYLICSRTTGERLLYFTDTYMVKYKFKHITHIMAECNYSMRLLRENTELGIVPLWLKDRIKVSHMSIEQLLEFFKANDLSETEQIYLIHISEHNGNPSVFRRRIKKVTGIKTDVFV